MNVGANSEIHPLLSRLVPVEKFITGYVHMQQRCKQISIRNLTPTPVRVRVIQGCVTIVICHDVC